MNAQVCGACQSPVEKVEEGGPERQIEAKGMGGIGLSDRPSSGRASTVPHCGHERRFHYADDSGQWCMGCQRDEAREQAQLLTAERDRALDQAERYRLAAGTIQHGDDLDA